MRFLPTKGTDDRGRENDVDVADHQTPMNRGLDNIHSVTSIITSVKNKNRNRRLCERRLDN